MRKPKSGPKRYAQNQFLRRSQIPVKVPFITHVHELRKRLFFIALTAGIFATGAYAIQTQLTRWLLAPAGNQQFIYTTPGGGFDFQFRLCLYAGIAAAIPVIVYQLLRYLNPLLNNETNRFLRLATIASSILALIGITFGYFFGLPAAMHFLLQSFSTTKQIAALISIQSYMSFVTAYLLGAALLFQIPLILVLINRIKPLPPRKLFAQQRWIIVVAFILGAIISPTPDIRNQLMLSVPIIGMYELGVAIIWWINRKPRRSGKVIKLAEQDREARVQRQEKFRQAQEALGVTANQIKPVVSTKNKHKLNYINVLPQTTESAIHQRPRYDSRYAARPILRRQIS